MINLEWHAAVAEAGGSKGSAILLTSKEDVKVTGEFARVALNVDDLWASITVQLNNLNAVHEELVARRRESDPGFGPDP